MFTSAVLHHQSGLIAFQHGPFDRPERAIWECKTGRLARQNGRDRNPLLPNPLAAARLDMNQILQKSATAIMPYQNMRHGPMDGPANGVATQTDADQPPDNRILYLQNKINYSTVVN